MNEEQTDIVVIGMGPDGEDAAVQLAQVGLNVTGIGARLVGGECPYWGCVPSKMMIRAANLLAEGAGFPAWRARPSRWRAYAGRRRAMGIGTSPARVRSPMCPSTRRHCGGEHPWP